jgi:hypothetical protein
MKFNLHYASHFPVLIKATSITSGPVLEIGAGMFSTPLLHWMCVSHHRELVSYETVPKVYNQLSQFNDEYHRVILIDDWDKADIERSWDVALIDHNPAERRVMEIRKLADYALYIIVHDTHPRNEKDYHYDSIRPLFRYEYVYSDYPPYWTTVFSNFINLKEFHI